VGHSRFDEKIVEKLHEFSLWDPKSHKQGKVPNTDQYLTWKLVS
jgi:hypothetical protein